MAASPALPDDLAAAHDMIARLSAVLAQKDEAITRQEQIIAQSQEAIAQRDIEMARLMTILRKLQRRQFGQKSEKLDPDQMALGFEDIEAAIGDAEAQQEAQDATRSASRGTNRGVKRGKLPAHLPRIEHIVDIEDKSCPGTCQR